MKKEKMFWTAAVLLAILGSGCAHDDLAPLSLVSAKEVSEQKKQQDAAKAASGENTPAAVPSPSPSPSPSV